MRRRAEKLPLPAICEQLAEECSELAQAGIKMSRYLRNENPPRKPLEEILASIREEYNDVLLCITLLEFHCFDCYTDIDQIKCKLDRWLTYLDGDKK